MSGSYLSTVANAVNLNKNTIAAALLIASTLAFIQRRGKMRALFRLLDGKIFKNRDQAMAEKLEEEDELELELDCVVCLNCVSPGEKYKILPTCKHGFHVNCIDAWLQRNSTCPLCRCPIPQTPIQYCSISTHDQDFDALISYLLRLLDHIRAWLMDPLNTLSEDCLRFP